MGSSRRVAVAAATVSMVLFAALVAVPLVALARAPADVARADGAGAQSIPPRVARAYRPVDGWCAGLRWQLVAAIGWIESGHGTSHGATVDETSGEARPWIFGPPLDGSNHTQLLPVGKWIGWFGLLGPWQQAVGPLQFLPGTFEAWAVDADGDGTANPHDIDDAAATAANYLCGGRSGSISDERAALLRYNHDDGYATRVLAHADELAFAAAAKLLCPVAGPTSFTDTFLAPRPGGRAHEGGSTRLSGERGF